MSSEKREKTIRIEYYAILREQRGCSKETVKTHAATPADLYQQLKTKHMLSLDQKILKVAINQEFRDWHSQLEDQDTVVFLPPVAGG